MHQDKPKENIENTSETQTNSLYNICKIQRKIRSFNRSNLHLSIFKKGPDNSWPQLEMIPEFKNSVLHHTLEIIITELTFGKKIVDDSKLYHVTTWGNFASIIICGFIYGNQYLKKQGIPFEPGTLKFMDVSNGDGNVICCAPGKTDRTAVIKNDQIKRNILRLSIDASRAVSLNIEEFNQFFKLSDFGVSWELSLKISDDFHIRIKFSSCLNITINFTCKGKRLEAINLDIEKMIYYGNIFNINRFCLVQLIRAINKIPSIESKQLIYNYLSKLDYNDLKKIFIIFAQNLTLYAEYNFNACLSLNDCRVNEVLVLGERNDTMLNFANLNDDEYLRVLKLISELESFGENKIPYVTKSVFDAHETISASYFQSSEVDFSEIPAEVFNDSNYIETRHSHKTTSNNIFELIKKNQSVNPRCFVEKGRT